MSLETYELQTGSNPVATIVILHGLGADANDFVPIVQELDLSEVGPIHYVLPNAPVRPVTVFGGERTRAWYDILGTELSRPADGPAQQDEAGLRASFALLEDLLASLEARGIAPDRTVLMGFSQGCAMTLMTGLRHAKRLAGLVGLSGYLPISSTTAAEASDANRLTPIFQAHGRMDGVVPFERGTATRDFLQAQGYGVEWHDYPIQHSTCEPELRDLEAFLRRVLRRA